MADYLDRGVADLLLQELDVRGTAIVARCEAAVVRRARAGEPVSVAFRDELRRALAELDELRRDLLAAANTAAEESEKFYRDRVSQ